MVIKQELFVSSPIARPPPNGYHSRLNYSKKSIAWLEWICHSARIEGKHFEIRHALTVRGEYHVPGTRYFVDGYTPPCPENPSGVVYEFYGCRYHGCPICYKNGKEFINPNTNQTALELFTLTQMKERRLRELGLKVVVIWEHEFDAMTQSNDRLKAFLNQLDLEDRLDPRDSLMGGRTNGCVLYKLTKLQRFTMWILHPYILSSTRPVAIRWDIPR